MHSFKTEAYARIQQPGKETMDQLRDLLLDLNWLMEISGKAHDTVGGHVTCSRAWVPPVLQEKGSNLACKAWKMLRELEL